MLPVTDSDKIPHCKMTFGYYFETRMKRNNTDDNRLSAGNILFLQNKIIPELGDLTMEELNCHKGQFARRFREIEQAAGPRTAAKAYYLTYKLMDWAVEDGLMPANMVKGTFRPVEPAMNKTIFTAEELLAMTEACLNSPHLLPILLMYETCISKEEAAWLDIRDHEPGRLRIRLDSPSRFPRELPLSERAEQAVSQALSRFEHTEPNDPVFLNKRGSRCQPATIQQYMKDLREQTGIEKISYRNFQSDLLVRAFLSNLDPVIVKDYLGYKKPGVIVDYWRKIARAPSQKEENHE